MRKLIPQPVLKNVPRASKTQLSLCVSKKKRPACLGDATPCDLLLRVFVRVSRKKTTWPWGYSTLWC